MRIQLLALLLSLAMICSAQRRAENWIFGYTNWLNFSTGSPENRPIPSESINSSTAMSDENGNLLYYGSGAAIYNRAFTFMKQPDSNPFLLGTYSSQELQGALTVPKPGSDSLYYYFYIQYNLFSNYVTRLAYAIINMKGDNGMGEVIFKDTVLLVGDSICPKLTASLHCNKRDIWISGHLKNSDKYFSLLLTSSGISNTPVYSTSPNFIDESAYYNSWGYMKINAMADKMAAAYKGDLNFVELADFNAASGIFSNFKKLSLLPPDPVYDNGNLIDPNGPINVEFSPNGQVMYAASRYRVLRGVDVTYWGFLHQFDLRSGNEAIIQNSRRVIDEADRVWFNAMQLAVDGKIYICGGTETTIKSIDKPDVYGPGAGYNPSAFAAPHLSQNYLPNILSSYLKYPVVAIGNCQFRNINFQLKNLTGVSQVYWDFGDPASGANNNSTSISPTHIYSTEGSFEAKVIIYNSNGCQPDTIRKLVVTGPYPVFLGNDTSFCRNDSVTLGGNIPRANYYWSNGSTDSFLY
jgi:hypothetical protein